MPQASTPQNNNQLNQTNKLANQSNLMGGQEQDSKGFSQLAQLAKYKPYLPVLILIITFLAGFFLVKPAVIDVLNLRAQVKQKKATLQARQDDLQILNELEQRYQSVMSSLEKTDIALPSEDKLPELLVQMENLAVENGLILSSLNFEAGEDGMSEEQTPGSPSPNFGSLRQAEEMMMEQDMAMMEAEEPGMVMPSFIAMLNSGPVQSLPIQINVSGSYNNFKNYLTGVENNLRLINIDSIDFTSPQEQGQTLYDFQIKAQVYYQ